MARRAKSRIRKILESWIETGEIAPIFLDAGVVFMYPSNTDLGSYYLVAKLMDRKSSNEYWACSCKGFRFSETDSCRHVKQVDEQMEALRAEKVVRQRAKRK
jgi:hypothetical protein